MSRLAYRRVHRGLNLEMLEDRSMLSSIVPTTLPTPTVGNSYNVAVTDSGATGAYTLSETGNLPAGLTFTGGQSASQITHGQDAGLGETSNGTSLSTGKFAKAPSTGDALVVWAWGWNASAITAAEVTCTDTGKNVYAQYGFVDGGAGNGNWSCLFVAINISGAANFSDTIHLSGVPGGNIAVAATEFSGVAAVDTKAINSGSTSAPSVGLTTTSDNDLLCAVMACDNTKDPATVMTPGGWTQTGVVTDGSNYEVGQAIYRAVSTASTYTAQWNNIGTSAWGTGIVALEPSTQSGGSLSGTPTTAGTSTFSITGTDSAGNSASQQYTLTVDPAIVVSPTALPSGTAGKAFSATYTATGGSGSGYTFTETGTLPTGLAFLNATISGIPAQTGSFAITVTATDGNQAIGSVTDSLTVNSNSTSLTVSPSTLPIATANSPYSATMNATGGSGKYTFAVSSGRLPSWMALNASTGVLSGTPITTGTSNFTITATDGHIAGLTGSLGYTLTVSPALSLTLSPAALPGATVNSAYSATLTATGGSGTSSFAVTAGSLPSWLALNGSTGVLSGTPTVTGTFSFTITATDSSIAGLTGSEAYSLAVGNTANTVRLQPTTLNTASSQYQNLVADFPLWITSSTADTLDLGPHGLVGTPSNVHVYSDPVMGNVFYASGSASNFSIPYSSYLDFASPNDRAQPFTISAWVNISISSTSLTKADNPPNMYVTTFDANDGASFPGYGFGAAATLANNGPIVGEFDVDGHEAQASMFGSASLNDGNWHLLVATYAPTSSTSRPTSTGKTYVDGVLDGTSNSMAELESPTVDPPSTLLNPLAMYIGTDDDGHSNAWQGMFADLRFYNTTLSATQIATMYAPATRWDLYTPTGGTSSTVAAPAGAGPQGSRRGLATNSPAKRLSPLSGLTGSGGQVTISTIMPLDSNSPNPPQNSTISNDINPATMFTRANRATATRPEVMVHKSRSAPGRVVGGPLVQTGARGNHIVQRATDSLFRRAHDEVIKY
jgi:hypothetical protein